MEMKSELLFMGLKLFAPEALRPQTNEKMDNLISLKDEIYRHSIDMTNAPVLDLYYVCCGKWVEGNGLMSSKS